MMMIEQNLLAGKLSRMSFVAFFLGVVVLFFDSASNAARNALPIESQQAYILFKLNDAYYRIADILGLFFAVDLIIVIFYLALYKRDEVYKFYLGLTFFSIAMFFYIIQRVVHLVPALYLADVGSDTSVISGPIYADLSIVFAIVSTFNTTFVLFTCIAFFLMGNSYMKGANREKRLGIFMLFTSVFGMLGVLMSFIISFQGTDISKYLEIFSFLGYSFFNFLFLVSIFVLGLYFWEVQRNAVKNNNSGSSEPGSVAGSNGEKLQDG